MVVLEFGDMSSLEPGSRWSALVIWLLGAFGPSTALTAGRISLQKWWKAEIGRRGSGVVPLEVPAVPPHEEDVFEPVGFLLGLHRPQLPNRHARQPTSHVLLQEPDRSPPPHGVYERVIPLLEGPLLRPPQLLLRQTLPHVVRRGAAAAPGAPAQHQAPPAPRGVLGEELGLHVTSGADFDEEDDGDDAEDNDEAEQQQGEEEEDDDEGVAADAYNSGEGDTVSLTRAGMESACADLLQRLREPVLKACAQAQVPLPGAAGGKAARAAASSGRCSTARRSARSRPR